MKTIGLFGGTFDPIHFGHLSIARAFTDAIEADMTVFLPAGDPYHKDTPLTAAHHRLAMTELAIMGENRFAASDCDIVRKGQTYTYDTISIFHQQFPQAQIWWLMGMDSLMHLHTWHRWRDLVSKTHIAVAARPGSNLSRVPKELQQWIGEALSNGQLKLLDAPALDISSSSIRNTIANGHRPDHLNDKVWDYICQHGLYRTHSI